MRLPAHPLLLETNARLLTRRLGDGGTLAAIPEPAWNDLAQPFDLVWLMGAWQRSEASRAEALASEALRREYDAALPGWRQSDVAGSPYAIAAYTLDRALGEPRDLARLRGLLNAAGRGLVLDFVPNHVARDHLWTIEEPDWCVRPLAAAAAAHPDWFFETPAGTVLAHGRDPNFAPWTDTAQLNYASPQLRDALVETLIGIAAQADGVRCDMAMLALNDVFGDVWGPVIGHPALPAVEFWTTAISAVKARYPRCLFLAEAYWGLEGRLLELGFDYVYDKALYDHLRHDDAAAVRSWRPDAGVGAHGVRFIENHDEARAATAFGAAKGRAAATVFATLPGLRLFYDGQREGRQVRVPVQLIREPEETGDPATIAFYDRLLAAVGVPAVRDGAWTAVDILPAGEWGNDDHVVAWAWHGAGPAVVVAVNYSYAAASCRLLLAPPPGADAHTLVDRLAPDGETDALAHPALTIALTLAPWEARIFTDDAAPAVDDLDAHRA